VKWSDPLFVWIVKGVRTGIDWKDVQSGRQVAALRAVSRPKAQFCLIPCYFWTSLNVQSLAL
jgi:hypothetical protein